MSEWISVTDRLPDYHEPVLGYNLDDYDDDWIVCWRVHDSLCMECHDMAPCHIDYWMPLPEPPEVDQ